MMEWYDTLSSTSDLLLARVRAGEAVHGDIIGAAAQTAGHGRNQKQFYCPVGGLYFSIFITILPPPDTLPVTPRAALAVRRVMERYGCTMGIKWVNDLYRGGKKAGGILTQLAGGGAVLGIGLNLIPMQHLPPELEPIVTSCMDDPACLPAPVQLAREISAELMCVNEEDQPALLAEYRAASVVLGQPITYEEDGARLRDVVLDFTETGGLMLQSKKILTSGKVHLRLGL
jgi:BirA family biotin operon repressor/biotin-[acetyl-CoA-carboxylase] ligase